MCTAVGSSTRPPRALPSQRTRKEPAMVQINPALPHTMSLEAAIRKLSMEDRFSPREPDSVPSPIPPLRPVLDDPVAAAVVLWGRCGYVASSRIGPEERRSAARPDQAGPAPKSGS